MMKNCGSSDIGNYAHGHQPSVLDSHATRTAQNSCAYFLDLIFEGHKILDAGCGPGSITLDLASLVGDRGDVLGIDFSSEAIAVAQKAAEERGVRQVHFEIGDIYALKLEPQSFDIVHAHQVLQHLNDPVAALREMSRVLKPGGKIAIREADYGGMTWFPAEKGIALWHSAYVSSARKLGGEPDAGRRLKEWAHKAGLRVESVQSSVWTYATPDSTKWWGDSQSNRVKTSSFRERALSEGLSDEDVEFIADAWKAWGEHPDAWFSLPHGEIILSLGTRT